MQDEDLTLETLLSVRSSFAADLDDELLRKCYFVQKRFQFSTDRSISASAMERLIDEQVKLQLGEMQG